ncbi:peroxiredoxin [Novosphingobium sp. G106]|uniref:peroxiredoxin n=1 Tax=Novosphingobium sp. G106 TaxID=2849500 RepID=UPI001C2D15A4|nr:peroxiredoxin [Novosphingobium sp. G106]MBV1687610.1 peroxiredoxin [Novosphingobium sp. G106]
MINRPIPDVTLKTRVRDDSLGGPNPFRWEDFRIRDHFAGKKVVVFSLPGAFTPTCSNEQCPNYDRLYDAFKQFGVDEVYCVSVNDAFVMYQWGKNLNLKNVKLLPDGNGEFTRRMGMLIDKSHLGFGLRSWRYAMVVDDNLVTDWYEEPGINDTGADQDPYGETAPEKLLDELKAQDLTAQELSGGQKEPA